MTNDGLNALTYDGENRLVSAGSVSHSYDGSNLRVKKVSGSTTTVYLFSGSKVIAEYVNGSLSKEYIYSGSALLATIAGSTATYHHADHLSVRATTDSSGNVAGQQGHYPFGESWYASSSTTKWQFTSYERDAESGNDYAMARYHISRLGRFNSPDPVSGSPADPQSWNRFAYSRNDPINLADPSGRDPWIIEAFLSGDLPFTNPYEFNLALMDAMARAHLGWRYSDLPGRYGGSADEEARYLSIITTGYDPALGIFRGDVHILADRPDGSQGGVVLTNPTLAEVNAVLVQAAIWASETSPFVFSQFPQLAAAGAGAGTVSVAVTWIGTGGAVIGSGTLLVAGGVVVGAAALGYGGYLAYRYFKIPKIIRDAAGQVGVSARALGRAVEQFKFNNNLPPNFNLDWTTIIGIAEALKRGEYYTK